MLFLLRNIIFRFWLTMFIGGLLAIWSLPLFAPLITLERMLYPAMIIFILVFFLSGYFLNRYGITLLERFISEATIWDRAGRSHDADDTYRKAVAVFDSFILSQAARRKSSVRLISHMARFYLARADKNHRSEAFVISYLNSHPDDGEVAENWLQQLKNGSVSSKESQELAFRIGQAQQNNMTIQNVLARLYLSAGRSDFQALQTYRHVLKEGGKKIKDEIIVNLSNIFLDEGRADEWALEIYLQAYQLNSIGSHILRGVAACVHWISASENNSRLFHQAGALLHDISEAQLKNMRIGFNPPVIQTFEVKPSRSFKAGIVFFETVAGAGTSLYRFVKSVLYIIHSHTVSFVQFIRSSRRWKHNLKWLAIAAVCSAMILMLINTLGHLLKTKMISEKEKVANVMVTDPFTLQVAAYLKPAHAEKHVAFLKKHKLDAYWTQAVGNKKKWYQVRISHFTDKKSAITYGESLKRKGIIDDFYVANYP